MFDTSIVSQLISVICNFWNTKIWINVVCFHVCVVLLNVNDYDLSLLIVKYPGTFLLHRECMLYEYVISIGHKSMLYAYMLLCGGTYKEIRTQYLTLLCTQSTCSELMTLGRGLYVNLAWDKNPGSQLQQTNLCVSGVSLDFQITVEFTYLGFTNVKFWGSKPLRVHRSLFVKHIFAFLCSNCSLWS